MKYQAPSEKKMWEECNTPGFNPLSVDEKYHLKKNRVIVEHKKTKVKKFVERLKNEPDYMVFPPLSQHRAKWNAQKQSRFIECLITNFPRSPILLYQRYYQSSYEVIDGQQQIAAIKDFYENKLVLTGLELWVELNGMRYDDLPPIIRKNLDRTTIKLRAIWKNSQHSEEQTLRLREVAFERLSTGG